MVSMIAIGRHKIISKDYHWDSNTRSDGNFCLLQYTLNGFGEIKIDGKTFSLKKEQAFLITIPGNHTYYLPKNSDNWEVLYIEFSIEAKDLIEDIIKLNKGHIFTLKKNSKLINLFWEIYYAATSNEITDIYKCSQYTYNFLFEFLSMYNPKNEQNSHSIKEVKKYIKKNYLKPISVEDISKHVNISKSHLTRKFKAETGISPGQYLIKTRLSKATELLLNSDFTIDQISEKVGFSCANYFSKAFRHKFKISPTEYRHTYKNYYKVNFLS